MLINLFRPPKQSPAPRSMAAYAARDAAARANNPSPEDYNDAAEAMRLARLAVITAKPWLFDAAIADYQAAKAAFDALEAHLDCIDEADYEFSAS